MPPMPVAPGVLQLVIHARDDDVAHDLINRVHYHYTGAAPTAAQLATMAPTLLISWSGQFTPLMQSSKTVTQLDIIDLSSPTGAQTSLAGVTAGTLVGAELPADACLVVAGQVSRRYRGGHPRTYLPLGDTTKLASSRTWDPTFVAAAVTAMDTFMGVTTGAGWAGAGTIAPCNVSYFAGFHNVTYLTGRVRSVPTIRPGGPVIDTITSYVGRQQVCTQRRRVAA
jgi:hypothetical protein